MVKMILKGSPITAQDFSPGKNAVPIALILKGLPLSLQGKGNPYGIKRLRCLFPRTEVLGFIW